MNVCRVELKEANAFVAARHRHHKPVTGHRFSIGAEKRGELVGVAIVGRPVARRTDQKNVAEVLRVCTDGTANACSFLLGACGRIAQHMGFHRIQTFTLPEEGGASLRGAGWIEEGETAGGKWSRLNRARTDDHPTVVKTRWALVFRQTDGGVE